MSVSSNVSTRDTRRADGTNLLSSVAPQSNKIKHERISVSSNASTRDTTRPAAGLWSGSHPFHSPTHDKTRCYAVGRMFSFCSPRVKTTHCIFQIVGSYGRIPTFSTGPAISLTCLQSLFISNQLTNQQIDRSPDIHGETESGLSTSASRCHAYALPPPWCTSACCCAIPKNLLLLTAATSH